MYLYVHISSEFESEHSILKKWCSVPKIGKFLSSHVTICWLSIEINYIFHQFITMINNGLLLLFNFSCVSKTCTEMVMPIGYGANETMFQSSPFNLNDYIKTCQNLFGVTPRPHWITTEFGGHDIKSVLGNFASNIIFSNGLRDPYSAGGVLKNISSTVTAVYTDKGAHCLDLINSTPDDPDWLITQRGREIKIIEVWISEYKARLATNADKQN
ncbi:uncharacterized protein LOC107410545 [Ziziphus jujuba]|uniref:Uncharacterized protein LOC107410545 n=1 Tax=Ziziphus jujuba TaxID=326968 RepID=A0ABM3ZVA7_ZIZJJ|nr:uncharacterized protein LOC107410545 [Ziziphus jujuba]